MLLIESSRLARYLTKKGATVDSTIQWKKTIENDVEPPIAMKREREIDELATRKFAKISTAPVQQTTCNMQNDFMDLIAASNPFHSSTSNYNSNSVNDVFDFSLSSSSLDLTSIRYILRSLPSASSIKSQLDSSQSRSSIRLHTSVIPQATVLFIDIKNFTAQCAALPAGRVGEWVAAFYKRVDAAAAAHGVSKVEVRGDCCVCVAGAEGAVPCRRRDGRGGAAVADRRGDQATRMLAFAADLHADLVSLKPCAGVSSATQTRMGMATGKVTLLASDAGPGTAAFASVQGDAARLAAQMEALAGPGAVAVHRSTADRWAAEGRRVPPATVRKEQEGCAPLRAAVYDCAARAFAPADDSEAPAAGHRAALRRLRRCSSAVF
jgi:class 3 adenylate cyclase